MIFSIRSYVVNRLLQVRQDLLRLIVSKSSLSLVSTTSVFLFPQYGHFMSVPRLLLYHACFKISRCSAKIYTKTLHLSCQLSTSISKIIKTVRDENTSELKKLQDEIQKITDKFVAEIDKLVQEKEKEILIMFRQYVIERFSK